MRPEPHPESPDGGKACLISVHAEPDGGAGWEVVLPDREMPLICETLDDARRLAYIHSADNRPCELIIRDAYHRVIGHELLVADDSSTHDTKVGEPTSRACP